MNIAKAVKDIRRAKGISQVQLAVNANTDQSQIYKIEKGKKATTFSSINKMAKGLGVEPIILLLKSLEEKDIDKVYPLYTRDLIRQVIESIDFKLKHKPN